MEINKFELSIIVPNYNDGRHIKDCINSISLWFSQAQA